MTSQSRLPTALALLVCVLPACTHAATIETRAGYSHQGRILRNDGSALFVEDAYSGKVLRVPNSDVVGIRHPGTVEMISGGVLAVGGTSLAVVLALRKDCPEEPQSPDAPAPECGYESIGGTLATGAILTLAVPGVGMVLWGNSARTDSARRAAPPSTASVAPLPGGAAAVWTSRF